MTYEARAATEARTTANFIFKLILLRRREKGAYGIVADEFAMKRL